MHTDPGICTNRKATKPLKESAKIAANKAQPSCSNYAERKRWMDAYIAEGGGWVCVCPKNKAPKEPSEPCPCKPITTIELISIEFQSDHKLLKKYDADWNDGGARYPKPEWTTSAQHPVSHSMKKKIKLRVKVKVSPAGTCPETGDLEGTGPGGLVFKKAGVKFSSGEQTVELESDKQLKDQVQVLDFEIKWKTRNTSVQISPNKTKNTMYVTYGTPYNDTPYDNAVTEKRLKWVCNLCAGDKNGHASVTKIHDSTGSFDLSAALVSQYWNIAGGASAQCMDLSKFYMLASEMLGLRSGEVVYLYPKVGKTTKESTSSSDVVKRTVSGSAPPHAASTTHNDFNPNEEILLVDGRGGWNNFEACFKFTHPDSSNAMKTRYYAGGADDYDTAQEVMENVCDETHWTYQGAGGGWAKCVTPGPSPIDDW